MLIQFAVENYLSFDAETTFSMVSTGGEDHPGHLVAYPRRGKKPLLRAAAIYGANAAGKSNLLKAISFARNRVIRGAHPGAIIPVRPFRLRDVEENDRPSKFRFVFWTGGKTYDYGFKLDSKRVQEEWLFATNDAPRAKEHRFFERVTSSDFKSEVEFDGPLDDRSARQRQRLEFIAEGTRPNQLFLTEAIEKNIAALEPVRVWFQDVLSILSPEDRAIQMTPHIQNSEAVRQFFTALLKRAGTGIDAVSVHEDAFEAARHMPGAPPEFVSKIEEAVNSLSPDAMISVESSAGEIRDILRNDAGKPVVLSLQMEHRCASGRLAPFRPEEESDGTQRLVHLLPILYELQQAREKVVLLDELDRRFHPKLSEMLLAAGLACGAGHRSQFVFTTHDTNLLNLDLLRRDEIWFVEKDPGGASHLYSLAEFKVRPDLKIGKGYLNGRFGAIPFSGETSQVGENTRSSEISDPAPKTLG